MLSVPLKPVADDSSEVFGMRLLGDPDLDLINIYPPPPIRPDETDERKDNLSPDSLPDGEYTILSGDINAHHPLWDCGYEEVDEVGERMAAWLDGSG